jgi:hypothetical protein
MSGKIIFKKFAESGWINSGVILSAGEPGYAIDTETLKVGNGIDVWKDLPYITANPYGVVGTTGSTGYGLNGSGSGGGGGGIGPIGPIGPTGADGATGPAGTNGSGGTTSDGIAGSVLYFNTSTSTTGTSDFLYSTTNGLTMNNVIIRSLQETGPVKIGFSAGQTNQGTLAIAVGSNTGFQNQSSSAVAIGSSSGSVSQ